MASQDFSGAAASRHEKQPDVGYTAHYNPTDRSLRLTVNELSAIHYIVQPSREALSVIRFKTGDMFQTPYDLETLKEDLRRQTPFEIAAVPNNENPNLQKATAALLRRKPYEGMIVVKLPSDMSDLVLVLNKGKINDGKIVCDTIENCLQEPGRLRTVIDLTDSLYRAIEVRNENYQDPANQNIPTHEGQS